MVDVTPFPIPILVETFTPVARCIVPTVRRIGRRFEAVGGVGDTALALARGAGETR